MIIFDLQSVKIHLRGAWCIIRINSQPDPTLVCSGLEKEKILNLVEHVVEIARSGPDAAVPTLNWAMNYKIPDLKLEQAEVKRYPKDSTSRRRQDGNPEESPSHQLTFVRPSEVISRLISQPIQHT